MLVTLKVRVDRPDMVTVTTASVMPLTFSRLESSSMGRVKLLVPTTLDRSILPSEISSTLDTSSSEPAMVIESGKMMAEVTSSPVAPPPGV